MLPTFQSNVSRLCVLIHVCGYVGKVCARHWYDKSKHIFPASRWEVYDAEKDYSSYTVK